MTKQRSKLKAKFIVTDAINFVLLDNDTASSTDSEYCKRIANRNSSTFEESDRLRIFNAFWQMTSWDVKQTYVQSLAETVGKKQLKAGDSSRRSVVYTYALEKSGTRHQVCKSMVANTLGIKERTLINWVNKKN